MRNFIITFCVSAGLLIAAVPFDAYPQVRQRIDSTTFSIFGKKRRQLMKENHQMALELDSLRLLIEEYEARKDLNDSIQNEMIDLYNENEDKIGAGLEPEDYTQEVTDSLLEQWYLNKDEIQGNEEYDMNTVHFSSNVSDKVYLQRLEDMNSFITLPYNETVRNYIILYSEKMPTKMQQMLGLADYYLPIFEETFNKYGMPEELKYMAVIESALNPTAVSRAGAKGMWQFMYATAKNYGLTVNSYVDERLDPFKSADAAARYLRDSYEIFGDWNLAISSYNCGPGNVNKAIRRSGRKDFWSIYDYLPRETRGYVPAFVGAMYAFKYYKEHGLKSVKSNLPAHVDTFQINKMVHFRQISEAADIPMEVLHQLNPQYIHDIIPGNEKTYILRLPYNYTGNFIDHEDSIYTYKVKELLSPATLQDIQSTSTTSQQKIYYKVKKGDNLGKIAARYHVSISQIKSWNHLRSNTIRVGQRLVINRYVKTSAPKVTTPAQTQTPKPEAVKDTSRTAADSTATHADTLKQKDTVVHEKAAEQKPAAQEKPYTVYTVKKGDTMSRIAARYGLSYRRIMEYNNLKNSDIKVGQKLRIPKK